MKENELINMKVINNIIKIFENDLLINYKKNNLNDLDLNYYIELNNKKYYISVLILNEKNFNEIIENE